MIYRVETFGENTVDEQADSIGNHESSIQQSEEFARKTPVGLELRTEKEKQR